MVFTMIGITGLFQRDTVASVIVGGHLPLSGVAVGVGPVGAYLI